MNTKGIIEYWYKKIGFPEKYDVEFYRALEEIEIPDGITIDTYDLNEQNGKRNLLSFLYFCEALKERYAKKGISEEILLDTLNDLVIWTDIWSDLKGELYLGETGWLSSHLSMKLFKLGRLQFCMAKEALDIPEKGVKKGENIMEIHIPAVGPMKKELCMESIEAAKEFFAKYYPEFDYKYFSCHSWLLDTSLEEMLGSESNIIQFQNMFDIVHEGKSDAILKYTFRWNIKRDEIDGIPCTTGFMKKIKARVSEGGDFYSSYGIIKK